MASVFGTTLETGGNGEIEKALRKIVKDEVRKEQLKYGKLLLILDSRLIELTIYYVFV